MKNVIKICTMAVFLFGFAANSYSQVSANAASSATIVTPIAISKAIDMNFGNLAVSATGGTVILAPASTRSLTGGVTLPVVTGTVTAAEFSITGQPNYTYSITLPSNSLTITETVGGTATMTVSNFTSNPTPTGTLNGSGAQTLKVGATLNVDANQAAGSYTNATGFTVTVNYN